MDWRWWGGLRDGMPCSPSLYLVSKSELTFMCRAALAGVEAAVLVVVAVPEVVAEEAAAEAAGVAAAEGVVVGEDVVAVEIEYPVCSFGSVFSSHGLCEAVYPLYHQCHASLTFGDLTIVESVHMHLRDRRLLHEVEFN